MLFLQKEMYVLKTDDKREKLSKIPGTTEVQTKTYERYEVLTAVLLRIQVSWDVVLCWWVNIYPGFLGVQYLQLQHQTVKVLITPFSLKCLIRKMKALQSIKMSRITHPIKQCHISEDLNL